MTTVERPVRTLGTRPVEIRTVTVFGITIRVAIWPSGHDIDSQPPLLVFNGIGAGLELITPFADEMTGTTVITFDVPGAGESELPKVPYRLWMLAVTAGKILDALGVDEADVLGVSWGGAAAQQFAVQNPRRCRRLILAATTPGMIMVPPKLSVLRAFVTPKRYNDADYLREVAQTIYGGKAIDGLEGFGGTSRRGYLLQQLAITGWTSAPWLTLVRQPALVLAGDDDRVVRVVNLRILARLLPHARLHIIEDGHLFLVSSPVESAAVITDFLREDHPINEASGP